ncbi:alanine aminotransferase [miscellaneous Crenarchaeota group-1 archaeon SG8-32-3]|uniref:Aminotransferase n=1 Tax=miscellaneous Crenarchaeota group-1 archaeon SG8-32-3 TaxID=1685125 RepID=A0A0M0BTH5_9ARCH|nr:MAG: alanine aminotransferase [miscellaneous Crenarchaeota group-1 archaeon SG8-32-3]
MNVKVTERSKAIEYAIRDVIVNAGQITKTGKKMFYLNIGDPVAFDFPTPQHIRQALIEAVQSGNNNYSPSEGVLELRQAIVEKEKRVNGVHVFADNVLITSGVSEGIRMLISSLIEKGDQILVPGPPYSPYMSYSKVYDGTPVSYETVEEENWQPNIDDLRSKISETTRAIVINNPNNPTGALYRTKTVKQMLDVAGEHDLLVLSDEIYDQIRYVEDYVSTAHLAKDLPVVGLNGFSKVYLMTGWRLGYMYFYDPNGELQELKKAVEKEQRIRICASTPAQMAGIAALRGPQDHVKELVEKLRVRRDYAWKRLNEIEGVNCAKPEGAFYVFPKICDVGSKWKTDMEFAVELLKETGVLLVHGSGFDPVYGAGHVRAVFLPPIEILEQALNEIERFIKKK